MSDTTDRADSTPLRVVVGVDLRPTCEGALSWVRWLGEAHRGGTEVVPVHAVEWDEVWEDVGVTADLVEMHTRDFLDERGLPWKPRIFGERRPLEALGHAIALHRADLLVIGRRTRRDDDRLVQLGKIARRLLRRLPCPVAVCPADFEPADVADGPIVLALEPDDTCDGALPLARRLAAGLGKELVAVTVLPPAMPSDISYLPTPRGGAAAAERVREAATAWLRERDVADPPRFVEGPVVASLLDTADELRASAIVCGSRLLSTVDRIVHTSVGSSLAAIAPIPVVVAPPD